MKKDYRFDNLPNLRYEYDERIFMAAHLSEVDSALKERERLNVENPIKLDNTPNRIPEHKKLFLYSN